MQRPLIFIEEELALRFDHMLLTMQLGLVDKSGVSDFYRDKLIQIAEKLESKTSIPAVAMQLDWIQYIQSANFSGQIYRLKNLEKHEKNYVY